MPLFCLFYAKALQGWGFHLGIFGRWFFAFGCFSSCGQTSNLQGRKRSWTGVWEPEKWRRKPSSWPRRGRICPCYSGLAEGRDSPRVPQTLQEFLKPPPRASSCPSFPAEKPGRDQLPLGEDLALDPCSEGFIVLLLQEKRMAGEAEARDDEIQPCSSCSNYLCCQKNSRS